MLDIDDKRRKHEVYPYPRAVGVCPSTRLGRRHRLSTVRAAMCAHRSACPRLRLVFRWARDRFGNVRSRARSGRVANGGRPTPKRLATLPTSTNRGTRGKVVATKRVAPKPKPKRKPSGAIVELWPEPRRTDVSRAVVTIAHPTAADLSPRMRAIGAKCGSDLDKLALLDAQGGGRARHGRDGNGWRLSVIALPPA